MSAHHNRTTDTAVTPDRVSVHELNAATARGARKVQLRGLKVIAEEAITESLSDGRVFTSHDVLALVLPRYQIDPPVTLKDVDNAMYRIQATTGKIYRTGGARSGAWRYHAEGGPALPDDATPKRGSHRERPTAELLDQVMDILTELSQRVNRADKITAKLREIGIRIEVE